MHPVTSQLDSSCWTKMLILLFPNQYKRGNEQIMQDWNKFKVILILNAIWYLFISSAYYPCTSQSIDVHNYIQIKNQNSSPGDIKSLSSQLNKYMYFLILANSLILGKLAWSWCNKYAYFPLKYENSYCFSIYNTTTRQFWHLSPGGMCLYRPNSISMLIWWFLIMIFTWNSI